MKVLVACERSGVVRDAFIRLGHEAISCDVKPTVTPGPHIKGDIRQVNITNFDLMIAHPECTDLCSSGARWWPNKKVSQAAAIEFFMWFTKHDINWAIENPVGIMSTKYRKPDQIIQPWQFGHGETKTTCIWLNGLKPLTPTKIVAGRESRIHKMSESKDRSFFRSVTYPGIAEAMASQWGKTK